jgi:hypothetical protein
VGVPFTFDRYFPGGFESFVPLHMYLSPDYQRSTVGRLLASLDTKPPVSLLKALEEAEAAFRD